MDTVIAPLALAGIFAAVGLSFHLVEGIALYIADRLDR